MDESSVLVERFEEHRGHLRAVAYRMLGSLGEADDALQEAWLRVSRSGTDGVHNLGGWLTTVVARVCLNVLRTREHRREEPLDGARPDRLVSHTEGSDPEGEALLADSVGVALLVVLDRLSPAERLAFVLHDLFDVPFEEIGTMLERSPAAARQLASRARRRVKGATPAPGRDPAGDRRIAEAFLAATRAGDFEALVALLHPDVVLHADRAVVPTPEPIVTSGARTVAEGAMAAAGRARFTGIALVGGSAGLAMAPNGRLRLVLAFTVADGLITEIGVIAEPEHLDRLDIAVLDD